MQQIKGTIVAKKDLTADIFKLTIFAPSVAKASSPGQFIHVQCGDTQSYILRRPFSVHQVVGEDTIDILVRRVGKGTKWLGGRRPKDTLDIIGPLGNGFLIEEHITKALLVAGGMGVAPMIFLARRMFENKIKVYTLLGAATREELLDFMELKRMTRRVSVATEDGSHGHKGLVTDLLAEEIKQIEPDEVFACGPEGMLRAVAAVSGRHNKRSQVSLEARMACGVGACLGCAVETKEKFKNVCSDGPVFFASELGW